MAYSEDFTANTEIMVRAKDELILMAGLQNYDSSENTFDTIPTPTVQPEARRKALPSALCLENSSAQTALSRAT